MKKHIPDYVVDVVKDIQFMQEIEVTSKVSGLDIPEFDKKLILKTLGYTHTAMTKAIGQAESFDESIMLVVYANQCLASIRLLLLPFIEALVGDEVFCAIDAEELALQGLSSHLLDLSQG